MDYIQFVLYGTVIECVPHFEITLKEEINQERLKSAVKKSLERHLIFATKPIYDKGRFFLEENNAELVIENKINAPSRFGKAANGYIWQIAYHKNKLFFASSHSITDTRQNIIKHSTEFIDSLKPLTAISPFSLCHAVLKLLAPFEKNGHNCTLSYLGEVSFSEKLSAMVEDINWLASPDIGYCFLAVLDYNGKINMTLTNRYKTDEIATNLCKLLKDNGIEAKCSESDDFMPIRMSL